MAISIKKGSASASAKPEKTPKKKSWFTRGDSTQDAIAKEDKRIEDKMAAQGRMFRFWLPAEESAAITFVDGDLTDKGVLDCFMYREHTLFLQGKWNNFYPCTGDDEPCPICETGDDPSLVGVFTIIDHREYKGKKAIYKDQPKLFVAKRGTLKILQQIASKRGGLAGCTFDVTRTSDDKANVGDLFDFTEKTDIATLRKKYVQKNKDGKPETVFKPAVYEEEIVYYSADELRKQGFGKGTPIGAEGPVSGAKKASKDVETEMD